MRIAYFTTAQESAVFKKFYIERNINVNNSNQIFHSNLIRSLSQNNEVTAFSCRKDSLEEHPSSSKKTGNITWQYLATKKSSFKNLKSQRKEVSNFTKYNDVCFVDTTNLRCILNARKYCKIKKIPLVGIVTDNPKNISNQKGIVSKIISHYIKKCDAYVCLTDSLNLLFNKKKKKPYTIVKGINKGRVSGNKPVDFPYFFYAGTLLKKYGVYDLVEAFKVIKSKNVKLLISGHHKEEGFEDFIKDYPNVVFLGNLDNNEILNYENFSIANINPRPFMKEIDEYSVPSKVVEYSSKNSIIISGVSTPLREELRASVVWFDAKHSLASRIYEVYKTGRITRSSMIKDMNEICEKKFSINAVSKKMDRFLSTILK